MNENRPLLSAIIPVYRTPEKYLRSCLESVIDQTMEDFEVILVDDGSPDDCGKICDEFAERDHRFRVIHSENKGPGGARNVGLRAVSGRYLTFLDADDFLESNAWQTCLEMIRKYDCDCAAFSWTETFDDFSIHERKLSKKLEVISSEKARRLVGGDNFKCGGGYIWDKVWNLDRIRAAGGKDIFFPENLRAFEDKIWVLDLLVYAQKVLLMPHMFYRYRYVSNSVTHEGKFPEEKQFERYTAYDVILDRFRDRNDKKGFEAALKLYIWMCKDDLNILKWIGDRQEQEEKTLLYLEKLKKLKY